MWHQGWPRSTSGTHGFWLSSNAQFFLSDYVGFPIVHHGFLVECLTSESTGNGKWLGSPTQRSFWSKNRFLIQLQQNPFPTAMLKVHNFDPRVDQSGLGFSDVGVLCPTIHCSVVYCQKSLSSWSRKTLGVDLPFKHTMFQPFYVPYIDVEKPWQPWLSENPMVSLGKPRRHGLRMAMLNLTQGDWLRFDRGQKWATRRREVSPRDFFSVTKRRNGGVHGKIIYKWDQSILNFTEPNGFPLLEGIFRTASDFRTLTSSMDQCHLSLIWTSHCFLCHKWVILGPVRLKYSWIFVPNYLRRRTIHKKK